MFSEDKELDILQNISESDGGIRQRDLARIIGLSLGMTNTILKRMAQKGWLKIRKVNNRNIQYIVSAQGMEAIARRSYRYFRRTIRNVVDYKEAVDRLLATVVQTGFKSLVLVGRSDLDFIVEHLCGKHRLSFRQVEAGDDAGTENTEVFHLYSERLPLERKEGRGRASLGALFVHHEEPEQGETGT